MDILINILIVLFFLVAPVGVLWLCRRVSLIGQLGPIMTLYAFGMIVGNLNILPEGTLEIQKIISSAMVPLAIPMMLFNCRFSLKESKSYLLALLSGVLAVIIAVVGGFFIFKNQLGDESTKVAGLLTGVYTGGTPNFAALKVMLDVKDDTYLLLNSYDVLVGGVYMVFILFGGIKLFRWILNTKEHKLSNKDQAYIDAQIEQNKQNPYSGLNSRKGIKELAFVSILTLIIAAVSGGVAFLFPEKHFMVIFILTLTTIGVIASFNSRVRSATHSYDLGLYLIYVFCFVIATMVDLRNLDFVGGIYLLGYLLFTVFTSLIVQTLLSKIWKVDADTMVISSVSLINSPPFVPLIAATMKNRDVVVPGLSIGIIGYVIGNYLGYIISQLLSYV